MAAREQLGGNIESSLVQRVSQGLRYMITGVGPEAWFGPGQPLAPAAQDRTEGRAFDFPVATNLRLRPRNTELNPFSQMRALADGYDLLRIVLETRKDQIKSFDWEVVPSDEDADEKQYAEQIKAVSTFLEMPDGEHAWDDWLSIFVEDLLVIDAVAVYPLLNRGGKVMALELLDAATITRKIDERGRTPRPPDPAYQQILHGIPANDLTSDQLVYLMRNPRSDRLYGFSPVEQIIMTVNIALRRQMSQLEFYTTGNVPEAIAQVPDNWTPKQIADFQLMWDALNEGNTAQRRKMRFVPKLDGIVFPKDAVLKDEYDEWLARIVCFAFSIPPTSFVRQQNRATAEQAADSAKEEGLRPLMSWIERKMNFLIAKHLGFPEVCFKWKMENVIDPLKQAQVDKIYAVDAKIMTPAEVRTRLGMTALTPAMREEAWPAPPAAPTVPEPGKKEELPQPAKKEELVPPQPAEKMIHVEVHPPEIHLGDTFVRVAGAQPSPVTVNMEPNPPANVTVNNAATKVYTPDVNVSLGDTTVQADMRAPAPIAAVPPVTPKRVTKVVKAERQADGSMLAKIISEQVEEQ